MQYLNQGCRLFNILCSIVGRIDFKLLTLKIIEKLSLVSMAAQLYKFCTALCKQMVVQCLGQGNCGQPILSSEPQSPGFWSLNI